MKSMDTIVKFVANTKPTKNFQAKVMQPTFVNPVLRYQQKSRLN